MLCYIVGLELPTTAVPRRDWGDILGFYGYLGMHCFDGLRDRNHERIYSVSLFDFWIFWGYFFWRWKEKRWRGL